MSLAVPVRIKLHAEILPLGSPEASHSIPRLTRLFEGNPQGIRFVQVLPLKEVPLKDVYETQELVGLKPYRKVQVCLSPRSNCLPGSYLHVMDLEIPGGSFE